MLLHQLGQDLILQLELLLQGSDLAAGAAISLFLVPVLVVIAYLMLRVANRTEGA